tara:strand:- start:3982 stop:4335 length:354 start_codon:yes stop_codon:yes gene_type:complete
MARTRRIKRIGRNRYFSVSRKLRKEGKSSEEFEAQLSSLTLEDIIALKLELAARPSNGKLHGIFLWKKLPDVIKDAIIKAALSITTTKADACKLLGLSARGFKEINKKYETNIYFEE